MVPLCRFLMDNGCDSNVKNTVGNTAKTAYAHLPSIPTHTRTYSQARTHITHNTHRVAGQLEELAVLVRELDVARKSKK